MALECFNFCKLVAIRPNFFFEINDCVANIDFAHPGGGVQLQAGLSVASRGSAGMPKSARESRSIPAERSRSLVWGLPI